MHWFTSREGVFPSFLILTVSGNAITIYHSNFADYIALQISLLLLQKGRGRDLC